MSKANFINKCLLLNFLIFFLLAYSLQLVSAVGCGDKFCSDIENSCTCPADCGNCLGVVPNEPCREFGCVDQSCTEVIKTNCCPNTLCEKKSEYFEDFAGCPADCNPTDLNITILDPKSNEKFYRAGDIFVRVAVTGDKKPLISADVNATGFAEGKLYNDGKHNDGNLFDNIYANAFPISETKKDGKYGLNISAGFRGVQEKKTIDILVASQLDVNGKIADSYEQGDIINIAGTVLKRNKPVSMQLWIRLTLDKISIFDSKVTSDPNGAFSVPYHTTFLDPDRKSVV